MTPSLDTVGTFSRTIADQRLALEALAPDDTLDAPAQAPGAPRIGVIESAFTDVDPAVAGACENALRRWEAAGATLVALELPWVRRGLASVFSAELASFWTTVVDPADERLLPTVRAGLERGGEVDAVSYVRAIDALRHVRQEAAAAVAGLDLVAGPTSPIVAQPLGDPDPTAVAGRNTRVFNGLGWPAISIPVAGEPLPIGLQLAAAAGHDGRLLELARELTHPGRD
jgi:Asp-tRNA(Asn)/Glu-tRNA(Gln) amidotransferase A subunit family amidase